MNNTDLQLTLRQMQAHFSSPRSWIGIGLVGGLIGLVGPFGTFESMAVLPRILYWLVVAAGSYAIGFGFGALLEAAYGGRPLWRHLVLAGLLPGLPIALFVHTINGLTFGYGDDGAVSLVLLLVYCPLIALGVTLAAHLLLQARQPPGALSPAVERPALVDRLPQAKRGRLLHIAVADHYVQVTTDKGTALLLLRLSDAIREAAPEPGLQSHRSHWVAFGAVRRAIRQSGKPLLELENGTLVPVSRSYLPAIRAAGLID